MATAMATAQPNGAGTTTNVLIVGVGGQGVVLISKMLARTCQLHGHQVKQSEVHGMAKRGGVVFSHVRFGERVWSPTIPRGRADILVALEWAEGLRWLPYLKPAGATFISDTRRIVPPFAFRNRRPGALPSYAGTSIAEVLRRVPHSLAVDATGLARSLGNARAANTVLLGILSTALDFPPEAWQPVLEEFAPRGTARLNLEAFTAGRDWAAGGGTNPGTNGGPPGNGRPSPAPVAAPREGGVPLEINAAWCKGCDICVKMCPERCLALDGRGVVALTNPALCTGCHVCELLCPDFAIHVVREAASAARP
jgi:indolepyruvate ferredoxin oxidoreductase beta subunit